MSTFEANNTVSRWRVEMREWLRQRHDDRDSNRIHLQTLKDHIARMEAANEEFSLNRRHLHTSQVLLDALKLWETL